MASLTYNRFKLINHSIQATIGLERVILVFIFQLISHCLQIKRLHLFQATIILQPNELICIFLHADYVVDKVVQSNDTFMVD